MGVFDVLSKVTGGGAAEESDAGADDATSATDESEEGDAVADPDDLEPEDFREGAAMLAGRSDVPELDFTEESLGDLDSIATGNHPVDDPVVYGSYLGETLVREFDGEWVRDDGWAVEVFLGDDSTTVAVFDAARMALERGPVFEQVAEQLHAQGDPYAEPAAESEEVREIEDDAVESQDVGDESDAVDDSGDQDDDPGTDQEQQTEDLDDADEPTLDSVDEATTLDEDSSGDVDDTVGSTDESEQPRETEEDGERPAILEVDADEEHVDDEEPASATDDDSAVSAEPDEIASTPDDDAESDQPDSTPASPEPPVQSQMDTPADGSSDEDDVSAVEDDEPDSFDPSEEGTKNAETPVEPTVSAGHERPDDTPVDEDAESPSAIPRLEEAEETDQEESPADVAQEEGEPASTADAAVVDPSNDAGDADDGVSSSTDESAEAADSPVVESEPDPVVDAPLDADTDDSEETDDTGNTSFDGDVSEADATVDEDPVPADQPAETPEASDLPPTNESLEIDESTTTSDPLESSEATTSDDFPNSSDPSASAGLSEPGEPAESSATDETSNDATDVDDEGEEIVDEEDEDLVDEAGEKVADEAGEEDEATTIPSRADYEAAALRFTKNWPDRDFDYSPASLARLDRFLDDQWDGRFRPGSLDDSSVDPVESQSPLVNVGAYVGEVLLRHYDGEWVGGDEGDWPRAGDGEPAIAVPGRHGRRETFPVFDATRHSLIHPARLAYEVDALAVRLDLEIRASGAEETGFALGDGGPGTTASSADVITTILDRAEAFVDRWPTYHLDYGPASLSRLDNLVERELDTEAFHDATLGDWTDPDALRLADTAAGIGAYYAAILVRHLDAQWEIDDDVALAIDGPAGEIREVPFDVAVARLRGQGKLMPSYDRVYDEVEVDARTDE